MSLFRPSTLLPGRYLRLFTLSGPAPNNVAVLDAQSSHQFERGAPNKSPGSSEVFNSTPEPWMQDLCLGFADVTRSHRRSYSSKAPLPFPLGAHIGGLVHNDEEDQGTGHAQGRTAFGNVGARVVPLPSWASPRGVRTHMGHSHDHAAHEPVPSEGEKVVRQGFWADIGLTIGKAGAGYLSGSTAMIADAAHSFSDIALSGVSWWSVRAAAMPKDKEHPYGHGKYESLGAFAVSVLLIGTGAGIAWNALEALQATMGPALALASSALPDALSGVHAGHAHGGHSHAIDSNNLGVALAAALLSIGVKEGLYWRTKKVGEQTGSQLLMANAWHHRSDAVSSLVALVGIGGAYLGVPWLDPVAGMLLAGMIVKAGTDISTNSIKELVDASVSEPILQSLRATALKVPEVKGCRRLRARNMGSNLVCDLTIDVAPFLSVSAAHNVAEVVKLALRNKNPSLVDAVVHVEPDDATPEEELPSHRSAVAASWEGSSSSGPASGVLRAQAGDSAVREHDHSSGNSQEDEEALTGRPEDYPLQSAVEARIREVVSTSFHQVESVTHVTCHFLEKKTIARVTIQVDPTMTVKEAARLGQQLEETLENTLPDIQEADVHLELNNHAADSSKTSG